MAVEQGKSTISVRTHYEPEPRAVSPHITLKPRLGLNPLLLCTHCTGQLEVDYHVPQMRRKLDAFCEMHEDCKPMEGTHGNN